MLTQTYPVSVYRSTDDNAPILDRSPNCLAIILKACLVTGYGDKAGAGWTLDEDNDNGIKTFSPPVSVHTAFAFKVSKDTGREITCQVYDNDELKLQCATPFKYGVGGNTGKWCVIACERGLWFFSEVTNNNNIPTSQSGAYLYCGETTKGGNGERGVYLKHTGGVWGIDDDDRYYLFSKDDGSGQANGKLWVNHKVHDANPKSLFEGNANLSGELMLSPVCVIADDVYFIPAFGSSRNDGINQSVMDGYLCHSTTTHAKPNNIYVPITNWEL